MKIKYKKIIKISIAILLLCSNICSYAAASYDSNAFVTGEEFSKAISDFNRRITTFQAGINSKIDSQVSSYLDRNGIWNPSEQTVNPVPTDSFGWYADTRMTAKNIYCWVNGVNVYNLGTNGWKLNSYDMDEPIVNKIQKYGLACVVINFTESDKYPAFGVYSSSNDLHQDWFGSSAISDEYITVTNEKGSEDRYNINWATYFCAPTRNGIYYPKNLNAYVFVEVNDTVSFRFKGKWNEASSPMYAYGETDFRIKITDWSVNVY